MFPFTRLFGAIALASTVANSSTILRREEKSPLFLVDLSVKPATDAALDLSGTKTDISTIVDTIVIVEQKTSAPVDAAPGQEPPVTVISAVDGELTGVDVVNATTVDSNSNSLSKRSVTRSDFHQVFAASGTGSADRDCAIEGTAYLTYKLVKNATYNENACLDFCARTEGCVFANLFYEFNNPLLDFVFSEKSNLKCSLFADFHIASEKTNCGGQQQQPKPAGKTYMQKSSGYALADLPEPAVPDGYEKVFGPTNGANNAPGYMGFVLLSKYDVDACAHACDTREPDASGGACTYFNIWRAVVDGKPQSYTCSMYYVSADASTAVNYGQGNLKVTYSRGYKRLPLLPDGDFESYTCSGGGDFCYTDGTPTSTWITTSDNGGTMDAWLYRYKSYAHSGSVFAVLGSGFGYDQFAGTLTPAKPLKTKAGKKYVVSFFCDQSVNGPSYQADGFTDVSWNGEKVLAVSGYQTWTYYEVTVTAKGNDVLSFRGGKAPAYSFLDDLKIRLA